MNPPSPALSDPSVALEICAVCGRDAGSAAFCHIYRDGQRIVLCSPRCAEEFMHRSSPAANGYEDDPFAVSPGFGGWPAF